MVNKTGVNGINNGTKPPDDILEPALRDFARRQLSVKTRLAELSRKYGYVITKNTLGKLNRQFNIPSVRHPPPLPVITALVADKIDEDVLGLHGPTTIQRQIARETGIPVPRDTVRILAHACDPAGPERRFPGRKKKLKPRGQLKAVGIMEEVHCDGHEKLGAKALMMGDVGIAIYAFRDHTGEVRVRHSRSGNPLIGHVYLDFVERTGKTPIQLTFDCGTETGRMKALHEELRRQLLPELTEFERPPTVAMKSTDNIPIESCWSYWQDYCGRNIKAVILHGHANGWFASANRNHVHLFQWLWSRIVQTHLNAFQDYWNTTPRRRQVEKLLPTAAPEMVAAYPEEHQLEDCGIPVPKDLIQQLRMHLALPREEVMRWVPDDFDVLAEAAYDAIGAPTLNFRTGWDTFKEMIVLIEAL
ncbi:hypothetical protein GGX14DRAFT_570351 [Mycena pura]|uniref:Integrase catalytic domain-containing protein n=1 Tax=Mycena pura TaxID=153505 RepID=A0AAD6Y927_9AGAR|nr:hypothetical protein GGX14DRAFT_570351 [Mycena pura]